MMLTVGIRREELLVIITRRVRIRVRVWRGVWEQGIGLRVER